MYVALSVKYLPELTAGQFMDRADFLKEFGGMFHSATMSFNEPLPTLTPASTPSNTSLELLDPAASLDSPSSPDEVDELLTGDFAQLMINTASNMTSNFPSTPGPLYLGKSSGVHLIQAAMQLRDEDPQNGRHTAHPEWSFTSSTRPDFWTQPAVRLPLLLFPALLTPQ
jgi:hypothetical protein